MLVSPEFLASFLKVIFRTRAPLLLLDIEVDDPNELPTVQQEVCCP
jgi:hypothetical protein